MEERIKTYIQGFDDKLSGGIPPGHIVLICGEPGTMKSSIAFNILYHNALRDNRIGTYITLEQGRENFCSHLRSLGLDPVHIEDKVSIVDLAMIRKNLESMTENTWMEIFKMYASNLKKNLGYEILVVDSLPVLELMAKFKSPREELFYLFEWLRELNATCFLVSEMSSGSEQYGNFGEEFIADGIIHTKMERVDDINIQRRIRCVKMRGTSHSPNYYTLIFENGKFQTTRVLGE